ncbi:RNA ligase [Haloarculaceae archaeon H-GB2-1]|nr:RNA ligase [Haloarculaceae archaeon H-GB11]MEA5406907.1 RNA ligase [Haloarculaceae archaeon H-GB2-1]
MGTDDWVAALSLSEETAETVRTQFEHSEYRGLTYRHLSNARHGVERGTAVVDGEVVRGFPSIPRALVLEPAVEAHFDGPVTIEEKLNGYNVRVARLDGIPDENGEPAADEQVLAFTRSGYICPYTTSKVRDLLEPGTFFDDYPELMLCGELVGPENPYTAHDYPEVASAGVSVFDVRNRVTGEPLSVERRRELCEEYDFSQVPSFGTHDPERATTAAFDAIEDLDERGREGSSSSPRTAGRW